MIDVLRTECFHLMVSGKLAIDQQKCDLQESGFGCELVDGVASILKFAAEAIDEADGGSR